MGILSSIMFVLLGIIGILFTVFGIGIDGIMSMIYVLGICLGSIICAFKALGV
jgi:F420-0:gamma-glutamyl ligase-like protein